MRRRDLLRTAFLASLASPAGARQSERMPVVGVLIPYGSGPGSPGQARLAGLRRGLREHGYDTTNDLVIEARWLEGGTEKLEVLAHELVQLRPDVIVTSGDPQTRALHRETSEVPIVVALTGDLVHAGLAQSLARPGGNVTGLIDISPELSAKRLQLVTEVLPGAARIGILWNVANQVKVLDFEVTKDAGLSLGKEVVSLAISGSQELEPAFATARRERIEALLVLHDSLTISRAGTIVEFAAKDRVPMFAGTREFAEAGGLLSYGVDVVDAFRQAASFVHRILQGAKPADLPIEQPTKFILAVNLKTAQQLGITIPPSILLRADEVIE